jgi:hypothetical protein
VRKEGAGFDLPMAVGILGAMGTAPATNGHLLVGELSLDGAIRPVRGALPVIAIMGGCPPNPPGFSAVFFQNGWILLFWFQKLPYTGEA